MAPRGGGRSSSSGVSGSSYDASGSGGDSSVWVTTINLDGYGFTNGYVVANIVFTGIWMLALCGIAIWSMGVDRRSEIGHSVLGWKKYGIAISLMLILYAYTFAQSIILACGGSIANVFFLLTEIFEDLLYPATAWLLLAIYSLLFHFCITLDPTTRARQRGYFKFHAITFVLSIGFWIAILALNIAHTVAVVDGSGFDPNDGSDPYAGRVGLDLDAAFQAMLLATSIEILIFALWLLAKARQHGKEIYTASILFLSVVAIPFLILRVFYLAYAAAFNLSDRRYESWGSYIAFTIFTGACTVIVFVGVVIVTRRLHNLQSWHQGSNQGGYQYGNQVVNQPPVAYWPAPVVQTNPHYSYGPVSHTSPLQIHSHELHNQGQAMQEMPSYQTRYEKP